jgi:hypothetical protein
MELFEEIQFDAFNFCS